MSARNRMNMRLNQPKRGIDWFTVQFRFIFIICILVFFGIIGFWVYVGYQAVSYVGQGGGLKELVEIIWHGRR